MWLGGEAGCVCWVEGLSVWLGGEVGCVAGCGWV